jgi:protein-serine/threonine kinase
MPIPSSSGSSGSGSHRQSLRKPASTTFLPSPSPSSASNPNGTSTGGWRSIFRIPSTKRLNTALHDSHEEHGSSAEHNSYHSSRSSGSDNVQRSPKGPKSSAQSQSQSPSSYKQPQPAPLSLEIRTPRKQRSGFLTRKASFAKPLTPLTATSTLQSFKQQQQQQPNSPTQLGNGIAGGPISSGPKTSMGGSAARFLRRVASAPNAKGLLNPRTSATKNGLLVPSLEVPPLPNSSDKDGSMETNSSQSSARGTRPNRSLTASSVQKVGDQPARAAFRRTYSSNSMKHRAVEVRPSSFQKIKMLGRGDVGKVYLVKEKKTDKLFAMKGMSYCQELVIC